MIRILQITVEEAIFATSNADILCDFRVGEGHVHDWNL